MERTSATAEASFPRQIFVDQSQNIVEFDHIPHWLLDDDNVIDYTLPPSFCEHPGNDWIGIFRSDFDDLSKYIAYQYVPPPNIANHAITEAMPTTSDGCNTRRRRRITLNFSENSVNIVANRRYVLLYIEREEGSAMGVAGISNSFAARYGTEVEVDQSEVEIKKED